MFLIDHFLYTVSYKPILSVIQGRNLELFKAATKFNFYGFFNPQSLTLSPPPSETPRGPMAYELQFNKSNFRFFSTFYYLVLGMYSKDIFVNRIAQHKFFTSNFFPKLNFTVWQGFFLTYFVFRKVFPLSKKCAKSIS